jgi:hypothetical protein
VREGARARQAAHRAKAAAGHNAARTPGTEPRVFASSFGHIEGSQLALGRMDQRCDACGALHWAAERLRSTNEYTACCKRGEVRLPQMRAPPEPLRSLLLDGGPATNDLKKHARAYKNALGMASTGLRHAPRPAHGPCCVTVSGRPYHRISAAATPGSGLDANFAQIYVLDQELATARRRTIFEGLRPETLDALHATMAAHSPLAQAFKTVANHDSPEAAVVFVDPAAAGRDPNTYNRPSGREIGIIFSGDGTEARRPREARVRKRLREGGEELQNINTLSSLYEPLLMPLLYPRSEAGWCPGIPYAATAAERNAAAEAGEVAPRAKRRCVTLQDYLKFHIHARPDRPGDPAAARLHVWRRLFEEWICEGWARLEADRLNYLRHN